jgi:hypothetical protein
MARYSNQVEAEKAAHDATRRELEKSSKAHQILREYMDKRGHWEDFILFVQEREVR